MGGWKPLHKYVLSHLNFEIMATIYFEIGNKEYELRFVSESGYPPIGEQRGSSLVSYDVTT